MIHVDDVGPARWIRFDRPEVKNAMPFDGWLRLRREVEAFDSSDQRVLVLSGRGGEFCSGADLSALSAEAAAAAASVAGRYELMHEATRAVLALYRSAKPTLAAVDGVAAGAGMNLALACDLAIATTRARFGEVFVRRGLAVDFGGTWLLPRRVGMQRAKELSLTGRIVEAPEALSQGMVLELVDPPHLDGRAQEIAEQLAEGAPLAQAFIKQAIGRSFEASFEQALARENQAQAVCLGSEDALEGMAAFLERRPPRFVGR